MYKVVVQKKVFKFLEKHKGEKIISQFYSALKILQKNPYHNLLDIKLLSGNQDKYRLRISKYRFIYEVVEDKLIISFIDADSRGNIYK